MFRGSASACKKYCFLTLDLILSRESLCKFSAQFVKNLQRHLVSTDYNATMWAQLAKQGQLEPSVAIISMYSIPEEN